MRAKPDVVIVDYGVGNLFNVQRAFEAVGARALISKEAKDIETAERLLLPGVGAFGAAMAELRHRQLVEPISAAIGRGVPYLGICLGLQLLFNESEESPGIEGLGILSGAVKRFAFSSHLSPDTAHLKIPHMGWNRVISNQQSAISAQHGCPLLKDIPVGSFFYFVHSYYVDPTDRSVVALEADYGVRFAAMIWSNSLFATQFHPEKSQALGLKLLANFVAL